MPVEKPVKRVLTVSYIDKIKDYLTEVLPLNEYDLSATVKSASEAKRLLSTVDFDLVIINTPLPDELGTDLALNLADSNMGILLLAKNEYYDPICYKVEDFGIFTLQKPLSATAVYSAVRLLTAMHMRLNKMEQKNKSLQEKMADIRIVNRAKWLLIEHLRMTEKDAHYYIEKQAMDSRSSRREIAESIIRTYDK